MNRTFRKLTAVVVLGSVLESASAIACMADTGEAAPRSRFSILSDPAAKKVTSSNRSLFKSEPWVVNNLSTIPVKPLPTTVSVMLAQSAKQESDAELRRLGEQESEYGRRRTAALAKKGTGTIIGSVSIAAALGLAVLGWDKSKEEEEANIPNDERESGYYFLGAIVVGVGGGSWGISLRSRGQAELNSLETQKISFGADKNGNPVLFYSARF